MKAEQIDVHDIGINLNELAEIYGYHPFPPTTKEIDLGLEWEEVRETLSGKPRYSSVETNASIEGTLLPIDSVQVPSANDHVHLHSVIRIKPKIKGIPCEYKLELRLQRYFLRDTHFESDNCAEISLYKRHPDTWDLRHRIVKEPYLHQGIASELFKICESIIQSDAETNHADQKVEVSVGQLNVLFWFLKQGFEVIPEDRERLKRVTSGDPELMIISAPMDQNKVDKRQWYIVERTTYNAMSEEEFWEIEDGNGEKNYLSHSYRIRLRKTIHPTCTTIAKEISRVSTALDSNTHLTIPTSGALSTPML